MATFCAEKPYGELYEPESVKALLEQGGKYKRLIQHTSLRPQSSQKLQGPLQRLRLAENSIHEAKKLLFNGQPKYQSGTIRPQSSILSSTYASQNGSKKFSAVSSIILDTNEALNLTIHDGFKTVSNTEHFNTMNGVNKRLRIKKMRRIVKQRKAQWDNSIN